MKTGFEITLPATSANIGPAFDAAAITLGLCLNVRAKIADEFSISAEGRDSGISGSLKNNMILETYKHVLMSARKSIPPLAMRVRNEIPIGKGCGSSAAARLAGIALAVRFGGLNWNDEQILLEACRREKHPDNAVACWLGGLTAARMVAGRNSRGTRSVAVKTVSLRPAVLWPVLLVVPRVPLSTAESRAALPKTYFRAETVNNLQNVALLIGALASGRGDLLPYACKDHVHEPYRTHLCPLLRPLRKLNGKYGVLGVTLSGAGPSVLLFLDPHRSKDSIGNKVRATVRHHDLDAELLHTSITMIGAKNSRKQAASSAT